VWKENGDDQESHDEKIHRFPDAQGAKPMSVDQRIGVTTGPVDLIALPPQPGGQNLPV